MGYLDNRTVTVDAILTKKGRQLLSQGRQFFNITKFALSDDEVDYHLWNPAHPSGSNYYGVAIEQMPVLEPSPDETQTMRYKLVSLDKSTTRLPVVTVGSTTITFRQGQTAIIDPSTTYNGTGTGTLPNLNSTLGYTAILHNSDVAWLSVDAPAKGEDKSAVKPQSGAGTGIFLGDSDSARSVFAVGMRFKLVAKQITTVSSLATTLTIVGNETGGSVTISVTNNRVYVTAANPTSNA